MAQEVKKNAEIEKVYDIHGRHGEGPGVLA